MADEPCGTCEDTGVGGTSSDPQDPAQPVYCPTDCYWFSQGQCFLQTLPEDCIREILCMTPKAREDLLRCEDLGCCQAPSDEIYNYALNAQSPVPEPEASDAFQKRINNPYEDRSSVTGPIQYKDTSGEGGS